MGQFIILVCECGFQTNRAQVGSLLAHETTSGGFTVIEATFDRESREIVMHYASLPPDLEFKIDHDTDGTADATVNAWFDRQSDMVRTQHGPLLKPSSDHIVTTNHACPNCGGDLQLKTDGPWIA